jgi:hypothetical protein
MQAKLIVSFDRLSEVEYLAKAEFILASLTENPNYPEPWAAQVPTLQQLQAAFNDHQTAYFGSLSKDTQKVVLRNSTREILTALLKQLVHYLELVAQGDTAILATTGYDLRNDVVHNQGSDPLPAPDNFQITQGAISGTLDVHVSKLAGAGAYDVQTNQGDPKLESNWLHAITSTSGVNILLEGLIPGQAYWLRIRGVNGNGLGAWSNLLSIFVN